MRVYIAGKITDDEKYREKFDKKQGELEEQGNIVLNPARLPEGMKNDEYMRICFAMIDAADTVLFLSDYKRSMGAMLELKYCTYCGKQVVFDEVKDCDEEHGETETKARFKERLKELRKGIGMTQTGLAEKLGYGCTAITNYESGRNEPSHQDLITIAKVLNISLDFLIGVSDFKRGFGE